MHSLLKTLKHLVATTFGLGWLYSKRSYAHDGEDLFINTFFDQKKNGIYVDIGAHHPYRYSNTFLLHQKGWRGINIDATPGSMRAFKKLRPHDINLELAVGDSKKSVTYFVFEDSALNTLSSTQADCVIQNKQSVLQQKIRVNSVSLSQILAKHLPHPHSIDFLNIDAEGADEAIIRSNDWKRFRPTLLAVEILHNGSIEQLLQLPICLFLKSKKYQLIARFSNTAFFAPVETGKSKVK